MRYAYSVSDPSQNEFDSLPRLTFFPSLGNREVEVSGLPDSGATVNVLPHEIGIRLGENGMTASRVFGWQAIWAVSRQFHWLRQQK